MDGWEGRGVMNLVGFGVDGGWVGVGWGKWGGVGVVGMYEGFEKRIGGEEREEGR